MKRSRRRKVVEEKSSLEDTGGIQVKFIDTYIGSGVFATKEINKGTYVCEYKGQKISAEEGEARLLSQDGPCYLYFFTVKGNHLCIDATLSSCIGRFINDEPRRPNCKVVQRDEALYIYTIRDINSGEELRYDYKDKSAFWRKKTQKREHIYDPPIRYVGRKAKAKDDDDALTPPPQRPRLTSPGCDAATSASCESRAKGLMTPPPTNSNPTPDSDENDETEIFLSKLHGSPARISSLDENNRKWGIQEEVDEVQTKSEDSRSVSDEFHERSENETVQPMKHKSQIPEKIPICSMDLSDKPMSTKGEQSPGFGQDLKSTSDKPALLRPAGLMTPPPTNSNPTPDSDENDETEIFLSKLHGSPARISSLDENNRKWGIQEEVDEVQTKSEDSRSVSDEFHERSENETVQPMKHKSQIPEKIPICSMDLSDKPMSTKGEQSPGFGQDLKSTSDKPALLRPAGLMTPPPTNSNPTPDSDENDETEIFLSKLHGSPARISSLDENNRKWGIQEEVDEVQTKSEDSRSVSDEFHERSENETVQPMKHKSQIPEKIPICSMDLLDKPMSTKGEQSPGFGQDLKSTSDKPALLRPAGLMTPPPTNSNPTPDSDENDETESDVSTELDDSDNDPDFNLESHHSDYISDSSGSDSSEVIPVQNFPGLSMKPSYVKMRSNTNNDESDNVVTSTSDSAPKRKLSVQTTNNENGRKWDKLQYCMYCENGFTNLRKHFFSKHKNENEVKHILDLPKKSHERSVELTRIRNAGNYKHNVQALKEGKGTLVVVSRQSHDNDPGDYLPCEDCLGFFLKDSLWRHKKECSLSSGKKSRRVQADAALLLPATNNINKGLKENVFGRMVRDEVTIVVRNDPIILKVGEKLYQKHGHLPHLYSHISQKMRELGRFLICSRKQDSRINCLNDILSPEKFPVVLKSTKVLCAYNAETNTFANPSLALKLGHLLKKCSKVAKSEALIFGDVEQGKKADNFLTLCEDEWTDEISTIALQTLSTNKMNKGHLLPLSEDIMKLKKYFDQKTESLLDTLNENFDKGEWELLNQITLAQLVIFNRRRGGETQRMLVSAYNSRSQNKDCPQEITQSLSATEKILLNTMSRVEIRGKRGRTVPVLLTHNAQTCIDLLLRLREKVGVAKDNEYVFPRPNFGSLGSLRSSDVLRNFAKAAGLTKPELITTTRLRKHVATVAQVLSLNKNDLDIIASFMGHDINIHRTFYRLPQETLQVARMGRLLTAFNNGTIGQYNGKSLDEIAVDETEELSSEEEIDDEVNEEEDLEPDQITKPSQRQPKPVKSTVSKSGQPKKVQKLSDEQSNLLKKLFKANVDLRRELRQVDCEKVINKYEVLSHLSWQKVKNTVHNWITLEKKKLKKLL